MLDAVHTPQVGLIAFFIYPMRAIVRENAALMLVHLVVCAMLVGGIVWWLCTRSTFDDSSKLKLIAVSLMLPFTLIIMVRPHSRCSCSTRAVVCTSVYTQS